SRQRLFLLFTFFGVVFLFYATTALIFYQPRNLWVFEYGGVSPALAICTLLGMLAMLCALLSLIRPRWRVVLSIAGIAWVGWANMGDFKLRYEDLDYAHRVDLPRNHEDYYNIEYDKGLPVGLVSNDGALASWKRSVGGRTGEGKPKL